MKGLLNSKIVWLSIVGFVLSLLEGFTKTKIDPALGSQIVELDWSNIWQAIISALTILARWFFTNVPIKGLWQPQINSTDEFDAN